MVVTMCFVAENMLYPMVFFLLLVSIAVSIEKKSEALV